MLEMYEDFKRAGDTTISKEIACETLQSHYYIKPYYVYDYSQETYCLCGLLDCDCEIDATTGNEIELVDLS